MAVVLEVPIPLSTYSCFASELRLGALVGFHHTYARKGVRGTSFDLPFRIIGIRGVGRDVVLVVQKEPTDVAEEEGRLKGT